MPGPERRDEAICVRFLPLTPSLTNNTYIHTHTILKQASTYITGHAASSSSAVPSTFIPAPSYTTSSSSKPCTSSRESSSPAPAFFSTVTAFPCQMIVGKALKILLGLVTGSDAQAVQLEVETLRATLLRVDPSDGTFKIRKWIEAIWAASASTSRCSRTTTSTTSISCSELFEA